MNKWNWLSLDIHSKLETEFLLNSLMKNFLNKNSDIYLYDKRNGKHVVNIEEIEKEIEKLLDNKEDFTIENEKIYIEWKTNLKKKNKDQSFIELIIKNSVNDEPELVEKDIHMWLYVLATEKHDSRRIDNQLRWRSWRQWDPWFSQFYVALDDDLMKKMWWLTTQFLVRKLYPKDFIENNALEWRTVTNFIERAQKQMESMSFSARKQLFEFDSVLNNQRKVIYWLRDKIININNEINEFFNEKEKFDENWIEENNLDSDKEVVEFINKKVNEILNIFEEFIDKLLESLLEKHINNKEILNQYIQDIVWFSVEKEIEDIHNKKELKETIKKIITNQLNIKIEEIWKKHFIKVAPIYILNSIDNY